MEFLLLGFISDAFSLDGTVKIISKTDFASKRYTTGSKVFLTKNGTDKIEVTVESFRKSGIFDFVKFSNINTKEEALNFKGFEVHAIKTDDLNEGYYYFSDLIDCNIIDEKNNNLGKVIKVEEFPAQITLRIKFKEKEYFVPFIKAFIRDVDIDNKNIFINYMEGLI